MADDRFPASDFDAWAESYDQDTAAASGFPFECYPRVLDTVLQTAHAMPGMSVLDLGAGTGNLTALFASAGCQVWGTDFSARIVALARARLPQVPFIQADIRAPWLAELPPAFDRIVSAYAFHHFPQAQKVDLILDLIQHHLTAGGRVVIADIAFVDGQKLGAARESVGDEWDEEYYWIAEEDLPALHKVGLNASFQAVPPYAGVFRIEPGG